MGFLHYTPKIDYANQNCPYEIVKEYPKMVMFHALPILDTLQKIISLLVNVNIPINAQKTLGLKYPCKIDLACLYDFVW